MCWINMEIKGAYLLSNFLEFDKFYFQNISDLFRIHPESLQFWKNCVSLGNNEVTCHFQYV